MPTNSVITLFLGRNCLNLQINVTFQSITRSGQAKKKVLEGNGQLEFSKSQAYYGADREVNVTPIFKYDYFQSHKFRRTRACIWLASVLAAFVYFYYLREPSDIDSLLNCPPYVLTAECERRELRKKIADARKRGKNTVLLEEELEFIDVKEQAMKKQYLDSQV
ncbi:unnamed protein product [Enterobius vermicularis]|uniref:Uncharacterized protein n=1 Tax=Enterobius vermicularis TaxID=51028 RepID=A0A0N4VAL8_ENTVE|nr:unnamed protein product [Enterobius vermicularis]